MIESVGVVSLGESHGRIGRDIVSLWLRIEYE